MTKKLAFYGFLKYILFFALLTVLQFGNINGIQPFAFGMLFSLGWCNQKIWLLAPMFLASALVADFSISSFLCGLCCSAVFFVFFALHYKFKKPITKTLIALYAFLSQTVFLYFNTFSLNAFLSACCSVFVGIVCLFCYLLFFKNLLLKGIRKKYALDELVYAGVLMIAVGAGISCLPEFYGVSKFLFVFLVFIISFAFDASAGISFSVLLGFGNLLATENFEMFLLLTLFSFIIAHSKTASVFVSVFAVLVLDVFLNFYFFYDYNLFLFLPTVLACALFLLVGRKNLQKIQNFVMAENEDFSARYVINQSKNILSKKLMDTSNLFLKMQDVYVSMSKNKMSPEKAVWFVASEAKKQVCKNCPKQDFCMHKADELNKNLHHLSSIALARGKAFFCDVLVGFSDFCFKTGVFVELINKISNDYKQFCVSKNSVDGFRLELSNQLFGVSQLLKTLSQNTNTKIVFNPKLEKDLADELLLNQILCSEVLISFLNDEIASVTLVVKNSDLNYLKLNRVTSLVLKKQMEVKTVENSVKTGFSVVQLTPKVFFDVVFGCAGALKHGSKLSGDTYSMLRISQNKIMMALCDGMGSGKSANKVSSLVLDLIEKFYKAGFKTDLILENVNSILSMREEENFGALDVCVFDLTLCACDILKLGSPISFLKSSAQTLVVESGALPLGILKDVKPSLKSFALNDGDMVVLVSDGIVDSFKSIQGLKNKLNNMKSKNPQQIADEILDLCMQKCESVAPDDMTVLVGKIWKKI